MCICPLGIWRNNYTYILLPSPLHLVPRTLLSLKLFRPRSTFFLASLYKSPWTAHISIISSLISCPLSFSLSLVFLSTNFRISRLHLTFFLPPLQSSSLLSSSSLPPSCSVISYHSSPSSLLFYHHSPIFIFAVSSFLFPCLCPGIFRHLSIPDILY